MFPSRLFFQRPFCLLYRPLGHQCSASAPSFCPHYPVPSGAIRPVRTHRHNDLASVGYRKYGCHCAVGGHGPCASPKSSYCQEKVRKLHRGHAPSPMSHQSQPPRIGSRFVKLICHSASQMSHYGPDIWPHCTSHSVIVSPVHKSSSESFGDQLTHEV